MILMVFAITVISAFDLKCPEKLERTFRAKFACENSTLVNRYSCLLDQDANVYYESCKDKADYVRPGQKYVTSGGRKNVDCSPLRYQPYKFWSHELSRCVFKKTKCDEMGQIFNGNGSSMSDNTCRCDYTAGFAFVTEPKNNCACEPTVEDCICYLVSCPKDMQLDQDYNCRSREDLTLTFKCPPINKTAEKTKAPPTLKGKEKQSTIRILSLCLIIPTIILSTISIVTVFKPYHQTKSMTKGQNERLKDKISPEKAVEKLRIIIELLEKLLSNNEFDKDFQQELSAASPNYMEVLHTYKRDLLKNDCCIIIAGETSAGKTTLINQLVGKRVFFISNLAATGSVCRIRNSTSMSIKTYTKEEQLISEESAENLIALKSLIKKYTNVEGNPPELVDVYLPVPILKGNVIIVDTPGIGENQKLDNILLDFLPHAVSFLFIVNANNAGGIHEDRLLRILKKVLEDQKEMPCFELEDVIFLTNQWDAIENLKGDGDEEDQHTKTWHKIQSKLDEGWPGFNTDRLFKISLKQVGDNLKTPFTKQYKNFQALLEKTIDKNKNKRVEYYFRFVQKFAVDAEMGILSRIHLLETSDEKRKKTILKNQNIVCQLEKVSQQKMAEAKKYKTEVIYALSKKLSTYLHSDRGRREILNPRGRHNIDSFPLHAFGEEVFTRINMGVNKWCSGDDVMIVIKEIEQEMKNLLSEVESMIQNIEKYITGFARSIHDASFTFFSRSTLRVTLRRNGINFIEYLGIFFKRSSLRDRYRQMKEKKAEKIYEAWLLSFTFDQILSSFEDNFGPEYDKVIARIFEQEIPQKIKSFNLTMETLLDELKDTKRKKRSFTQLKNLVHEIKAQIEHFKDISQM